MASRILYTCFIPFLSPYCKISCISLVNSLLARLLQVTRSRRNVKFSHVTKYKTAVHCRLKRTIDARTLVTSTVSRIISLRKQRICNCEICHRSGLNLQQTLTNGYKTQHPDGTAACLTGTKKNLRQHISTYYAHCSVPENK